MNSLADFIICIQTFKNHDLNYVLRGDCYCNNPVLSISFVTIVSNSFLKPLQYLSHVFISIPAWIHKHAPLKICAIPFINLIVPLLAAMFRSVEPVVLCYQTQLLIAKLKLELKLRIDNQIR